MSADTTQLAAALGKIPSGLFIVTAGTGRDATGMLASWVQQCSFEPPHVSVAIRPGRAVHNLLMEHAPFAVSILGAEQTDLVKHFARGFDPGQPAFQGIATTPSPDGVPLLTSALASLCGKVIARVNSGDHDLLIGVVTVGRVTGDSKPYVHIRKSGLNY